MVRMEESIGLPRNDICPAGWGLAENAVNKKNGGNGYENRLGKYERGEVDRFEQYLREVKQASENTVQSYRRDLMQMITYLEEKGDPGGGEGDKDQPAWIYSSYGRAGEGGYHHFTDDGGDESVFNYECMQACIRRNPAESLHAPKVEKKAPVVLRVDQGISASGTAIRADTEGDSGQGDAGSFICDRNPGVRAYRDPDGRYQYEHWISGLSRRGEGADDPIWTFGESSAGGVSGACEKRPASRKGDRTISLSTVQAAR